MESVPVRPPRWQAWLFAGTLAFALLLAYGNSFDGPYLFDDAGAIPGNPTIRHFGAAFFPPVENGNTVGGRPLLNLSLALNFALNRLLLGDGLAVAGYHAANLLIHFLAALTLFGLVRRTLRLTPHASHAYPVAFGAALLWAVHPVQTESVTYMIQRAESLAGLLILFSLYAFVRHASPDARETRPVLWRNLSVAAAALGMAAKETAALIPFLVLLYDRAFLAETGSLREAFRRRRGYYAALTLCWAVLLACMAMNPGRGNTAGFEIAMPWWKYSLSQFHALAHYLRLVAWPHPLVFDYGLAYVPKRPEFLSALPWILLMAPLLALAAWAAWARPRIGYAAVWFFLILAPTSTIVPLFDPVWEHRLYLSLAAPMTLLALGLWTRLGHRAALALALLALLGIGATFARNGVWGDEVAFWQDSVDKVPDNKRSRNNLGTALCKAKRFAEAEVQLRKACALDPEYAEAWNNLGTVFYYEGRPRYADAEAAFRQALRLRPFYLDARNNLGTLLLSLDKTDDAWAEFARAGEIAPDRPESFLNIGFLCLRINRPLEAATAFGNALRVAPDQARAHAGLGIALERLHRPDEAARHLRRALELNPGDEEARAALGRLRLPPGAPKDT